MTAELYLRIPPCRPANEVASFVRECEEAGLTGVGLLDSQLLVRELFVTMGVSAHATSCIRLATAVANPVTRHVSVLASAVKTVEEMASGRTELWIGRGLTAVGTVGQRPASLAETRETIVTLRKLLAGEEVEFDGVTSRLRHGGGERVPVYLAATGPKVMALAGEVADGVLVRAGIHPKGIAEVRQHVAEGARRAGRDPKEVGVIAAVTTVIEDDLEATRERARPMAVQWLMEKNYAHWLRVGGVDTDRVELPRELWDLYPDVAHAVDRKRAEELCAFLPHDMLVQICDILGLIGTPEYCAQRVKEAVEAGVDRLYLMGESTYELPYQEMEACRDAILPAIC